MFELIQDFWTGVREAAQGWVVTFYAKQFGKNERIQFYESVMGVLEDGIAIEEALETVAKAFSGDGKAMHPVSVICGQVAMLVRGGKSLADACRSHLPYDEASLVETGEKTGNLVGAFRDCVRLIEARQRIARLVISVVALPSITWSLMGALLYVIATWMVPSMAQRQNPELWTGIPSLLYALSNLVTHYGLLIVAVVLTLIVVSFVTLPYFCGLQVRPDSPIWKTKLSLVLQTTRMRLESIPPWSIYKVLHGSIFLLNMSVMLRAGVGQLSALSILSRSASPGCEKGSKLSTTASARVKISALRSSWPDTSSLTRWPSTSYRSWPPDRALPRRWSGLPIVGSSRCSSAWKRFQRPSQQYPQ